MNIEDVRNYCLTLPGVTEDSPYGDDMVVFRIEGKIFLHLPLEYDAPRMAVKLPPDYAIELRDKYAAITPSWHLNKTHWSDILIEGHFDDDQLREWIDQSYQLVFDKLPKKVREKYQSMEQPKEKKLTDYEKYCKEQETAFDEELGDDRCFPDMPEGHFVRSH